MGCCIRKCRPDKPSQEDQHQFNHVHDKLVISQASPTSSIIVPHHSSKDISPSPHSPTSSTSTITSFTCTTTSNATISSSTSSLSSASSTSSLSSASSTLTSKDSSFSNDFLWSCYKDNPHITRINSLREATTTLPLMPTKPKKPQPRNIKPSSPKHSLAPKKLSSSMPQKRVRSNSPANLTRQKSFRKHTNSTICLTPYVNDSDWSKNIGEAQIVVGQLSRKEPEKSNIPSRMLGSPSPSRRSNINGDKYCGSANNSVSKPMINAPKVSGSAAHSSHCVSYSVRKESFKAASPNNSSRRFHNGLKQHREICTAYRVGSKIDETVVNDVLSNHDMDSIMEDIDNPLISLDCFIFL